MKKALIFDLDGTLWDACDAMAVSWTEALRAFSCNTHTVTRQMAADVMGMTNDAIARRFCPELDDAQRLQFIEQASSAHIRLVQQGHGQIFPGVTDTLRRLADDYFLAIVSNCTDGYIDAFLTYPGLDRLFSDYEYLRTGKPKSDNIRLVMERNRLTDALYIGDTMLDYEAAHTAGIPFLHAAYGFGHVPEGTPFLRSIRELPQAAAALLP